MKDLVLLHSLLTDRSAFDGVKGALARDFRLHVPDLPGYGGCPSRGEDSIAAYADRLAPDIPQGAAVLGNGFGGFVAVALAIRHGAGLGALVAAPALAGFPAPAREPFRVMAGKVREGGMTGVLDAAINRMFPPAFIAAHPEVVAERKRALAKADPLAFARACLALASLDFGPDLEKIGLKTLVMAGELDSTTPAPLAREFAARIPGARFEELKGCGHCPQIEAPAPFVSTITRFLKG
jgi:3-oxoadipate enol-lactonase